MEKRFYILVPNVVNICHSMPHLYDKEFSIQYEDSVTIPMTAGRLMAQTYHIGRKIEWVRASLSLPYQEITAIVLSVRNSKELNKITNELYVQFSNDQDILVDTFYDHNPEFYGTPNRVHTATVIGPVNTNEVENILCHLDLY